MCVYARVCIHIFIYIYRCIQPLAYRERFFSYSSVHAMYTYLQARVFYSAVRILQCSSDYRHEPVYILLQHTQTNIKSELYRRRPRIAGEAS